MCVCVAYHTGHAAAMGFVVDEGKMSFCLDLNQVSYHVDKYRGPRLGHSTTSGQKVHPVLGLANLGLLRTVLFNNLLDPEQPLPVGEAC